MNSSSYERQTPDGTKFELEIGQSIGKPPFNDRCVAIGGRCARACTGDYHPMPHCDAQGNIQMDELVKPLEAPNNRSTDVYVMLVIFIAGFAVKVLTYFPALFQPYSHADTYDPKMTEEFRYIAVAIPTAGENKACVLRNMIGAVSSIPRDCRCRFHVLLADEGHRVEQRDLWQSFCDVLDSLLSALCSNPFDTDEDPKYMDALIVEDMFRFFMKTWVEETKLMTLSMIDDSGQRNISDKCMEQLCGRTTIERMKAEAGGWMDLSFLRVEKACTILEDQVRDKTRSKENLHLDDCADWPRDFTPVIMNSWPNLHLHYVARAKPAEDDRSMKVQRVAAGTWYYSVPPEATPLDWLDLRSHCCPVEVGEDLESCQEDTFRIPMQTSRGKAGGLNFTANYLRFLDCEYSRGNAGPSKTACLFSICDARHQYQADFMHATIPSFFDRADRLCDDVGFAQSPQYFPEMPDALDFLDTNNAQFFRLNCMLRNCAGGVSSCGTNGTWKINYEPGQSIWERSDNDGKEMALCEHRIFGESCKVEDTASSLDSVLKGRHSQYINRHVSYGMAKNPLDYLAAVQRWAEGGVVLSLQTYFDFKQQGVHLVYIATLLYIYFFAATIRATIYRTPDWFVLPPWVCETLIERAKGYYSHLFENIDKDWPGYYRHAYERLLAETTVWFLGFLGVVLVIVFMTAMGCWCQSGKYRLWPKSLRMWGRLFICVDNITYFLWCWVAFGWIGMNMGAIFVKRGYDFDADVIIYFTVLMQILTWGLLISANFRYTLYSSATANEVIFLSLNNIWRGTQIFYMSAPLQLYSIFVGAMDYLRYRNFGEDISYWVGGDRGAVSRNIVKYWTLLILLLVMGAWIWYFATGNTDNFIETLPSVVIVTVIGLDVLHPCTYLWLGNFAKLPETVSSLSWYWKLLCLRWWQHQLYHAICNPTVTGFFRWIGPFQHLAVPVVALALPAVGIHGAFLLVVTSK
jgi:hypothetical protein